MVWSFSSRLVMICFLGTFGCNGTRTCFGICDAMLVYSSWAIHWSFGPPARNSFFDRLWTQYVASYPKHLVHKQSSFGFFIPQHFGLLCTHWPVDPTYNRQFDKMRLSSCLALHTAAPSSLISTPFFFTEPDDDWAKPPQQQRLKQHSWNTIVINDPHSIGITHRNDTADMSSIGS